MLDSELVEGTTTLGVLEQYMRKMPSVVVWYTAVPSRVFPPTAYLLTLECPVGTVLDWKDWNPWKYYP